ncbi:MAG: response regulator [Oscillospiraceae bacterium]
MTGRRISVLIVEDDPDYIFLIQSALRESPDIVVAGAAQNASDAVLLAKQYDPDIVLMDLSLSDIKYDGIEIAKEIRLSIGAKIIILSGSEEPDVVIEASKKSFASEYLFKRHYTILNETIRQTAEGHTPHEYMILSTLISSLTNAEKSVFFDYILGDRPVSLAAAAKKTIDNQKSKIYHKLGIKGRKDALHIFGAWLEQQKQLPGRIG